MSSSDTLGDAYVNIMGNLNPLTAAFAQGHSMAQAFTSSLGSTLTRGVMMFAAPFIAGLSIESVMKEWMGKEEVVNKLSIALRAGGDAVDFYLPKLEAFANEMQNTSLYSSEAIVSSMAHAKSLGIQTNQLEDTTKAAIGLAAKIGVGLPTAMQLLIRASHGSTQRLKMYGIELDQNASKQEKFNQLLKIGADAMPLAAGQITTLAGQLTVLRNAWGDMLSEVGEGLAEPLAAANASMKESISMWTKDLKKMKESGIFSGITAAVLNILTTIYTVFKTMFQGLYAVLQVAVIIPLTWMMDRIMNAMMFAKDVFDKVTGKTPDRSWGSVMEGNEQKGVKGLGERYMEGFQDIGVMFKNTADDFTKALEGNTAGFADAGEKAKPGKKTGVKEALEGKAGEVFSFADAWSRMQKDAAKDADSDNLKSIAESSAIIAANTQPSGSSAPPVIGSPPLSQTPGGDMYAPGVVSGYEAKLQAQASSIKSLRAAMNKA